MLDFPLEPDRTAMTEMGLLVLDRVVDRTEKLSSCATNSHADPTAVSDLVHKFLSLPPEHPGDLKALLDHMDRAVDCALETAGASHMAYVPGGGLYTSALAEFYTRAVNRYGSLAFAAPVLTAMEESVLRWIALDVCGLPKGSGGLLTTGGSMATFSAVVVARHEHLGEDLVSCARDPSAEAGEGVEDLFGCLGPDERLGV
ncbi:pyridoxal-dependent decarboxylase, partial [Streptomyces sp. NPDC048419]|uniref:pyridoxal-dependent decarboxylase n=1 Tax=Streptomyces sp. NPDC048419 TaxID=3365547 RepID=UPI0037131DF0